MADKENFGAQSETGQVADAGADAALPAKVNTYSSHAIHMMRVAQTNTLTLSRMADHKASILMGATFLVFSLSVSRSLTSEISVPLILLALFSFLSSLCAVMAVMPSVGKPKPGRAGDVGKPNTLFFGHFAELDEEEWMQRVLAQMTSDEAVFRAMMHDIYQNGQILQRRKYRFLGLAYRMFIGGLFVTLGVYMAEYALHHWL